MAESDIDYLRADKELIFSEWDRSLIPIPPACSCSPEVTDRVRGMLLGLAVGDALGNQTEGLDPARRSAEYGEIRDYVANSAAGGRKVGTPAADSQLAFWTLESILEEGRLDPTELAEAYGSSTMNNVSETMRGFLLVWKMVSAVPGFAWWDAGQPSATNGALSRQTAVVLPHLRLPSRHMWDDVVCSTALTHRDDMAVTASVGYAGLLCEALAAGDAGICAPEWPLQTFLRYGRPVEAVAGGRARAYRTRRMAPPFEGSLCDELERVLPAAWELDMPLRRACAQWESGSFLMETMPSFLYVLMRHLDDPEEAVVRAVNDTRDNDTIGALAGAVVGAFHGERALPERWRTGLLGRTRRNDDGHVHMLLVQAVGRYVLGEIGI